MSDRPTPAAVEVERLSVGFDGAGVLDGLDLSIRPGETLALLGPSGCGKTTLLRAIAGLEPVTSGTIKVRGRLVSGRDDHVRPEERRVGMVFQDWALFPHLDVGSNVAYGLPRDVRRSRSAREERVAEALDMVGLAGYEDRAPHTLSGGQQQRVALARALAPRPDVLLLDEPFSNLDTGLRSVIRTEVHRLLHELQITAVFVTHDQQEAFVLGDRVAVMRHGQLRQLDTAVELYQRPIDPWVAQFVGEANLVSATVDGSTAHTSFGPVATWFPPDGPPAGPAQAMIRPEQLSLSARPSDGASGTVGLVAYGGRDTTYEIGLDDRTTVLCRIGSVPRFEAGQRVGVLWTGDLCPVYPAETTTGESRWGGVGAA